MKILCLLILVISDISENSSALYIVNVERNGKIIYTWKGNQRNTHIGLYDLQTKQNEHLYMFERDLQIISCSVNDERTLLAVSFRQYTEEDRVSWLLQSVSKYLTLLIEIQPINNVRVLKAVDSCVRVQFLYPVEGRNTSTESRLLIVSEDKYIEQFDIRVVAEEEHKMVIQNSGQLPRARVVDDLIWAQWDMMEQRLFYIVPKESKNTLKCVQFYPDENFNSILEAHLDISVNDTQLKLVNFGYDYCQDQDIASKSVNLQVFTSKAGGLCVCCSLASDIPDEIMYSIYFLHKGYNKTFTVSLERAESHHQLKEVAFMNLDYYVAAYLPGQFLHLLNIQHPDLLCYSLFLTGEDARIDMLQNCSIQSPLTSTVLDCHEGSMYAVSISDTALLQFLQNSKQDSERLAALHCALLYFRLTEDLEMQIIWWISENLSTCHSFDPIQEFIIASLYCRMCAETHNLDKLLPYTSLLDWIGVIPGVTCATDIISVPVLDFQNSKGFWEKLNSNLESVKYAEPHLHYHNTVLRREWRDLSEEREERRTTAYLRNIFENAKKVLSHLDTWDSEERLIPLFQEEDYQQQLLMGLMVAHLKDHLMRHLQYVGKKKIDQIVLDYVANLLNLVHRIMKEVWRRYQLHSCIFCFDERGSAGEFAVFRIMSRILEAANGMCMPLPPGFHTLHLGLGVRCLPLHTLLHYIDTGVLHLTETCVRKLLKDLDNTEKNEKLKFSIVMRLPEALGQKVRQFWNHPINANFIARKYVKFLLEKLGNRQCSRPVPERLSVPVEFLPLNYLTSMLVEIENQGVHLYEKQDHVNVRFVEEVALKHTMMLLGLKYS
ncbi:PREDICTED: gamma-secretase-activating protein [Buceros rhinoceros silvestris]|uniref:gamma-secretase-activating protein n=1 Tax=Buceros rhinoceros silvestris TaxID=175836 RepID=UPI0005286F05|nr:PREDICTED: gamma-secretase-activating protein [Buceros rhinoceros silvestris]